jgi:hypothetical protein
MRHTTPESVNRLHDIRQLPRNYYIHTSWCAHKPDYMCEGVSYLLSSADKQCGQAHSAPEHVPGAGCDYVTHRVQHVHAPTPPDLDFNFLNSNPPACLIMLMGQRHKLSRQLIDNFTGHL